MAKTTVIVPIFNALSDLQNCLRSLKSHTDPDTQVILINDASTDIQVRPWLEQWMHGVSGRWTLLHNQQNQGFVATVNRGMQSCTGDVLLLNTDTEVSPGWLEQIERCAASDERIASVTPFTNNGEIASWPEICTNNPWPTNLDSLAAACRTLLPGDYQDIPTAVGFCMWIRREALLDLGLFDVQAFGLGYGEENDFSQRAIKKGWRNVLCHHAFVAHRGGASFSPIGLKPNGEALEIIKARFPDYIDQVMKFIREDPLKNKREALLEALNRLTA